MFGGSEGTNLTGNAYLYLLGGEVTRRVFSGWSGTFKSFETYTIKAGKGGSVDTIGNGVIFLKPDVGMAAQVGGKTYGAENINVSTGTTDVKFVEQSI